MLDFLGCASLGDLVAQTVPAGIRLTRSLQLGPERGEFDLLEELRAIASQNQVFRSFIGMGYHDCVTPPVILRNVLENPGWYTQYTPYQAEVAQGRLEALLNFQTMVSDLTGLPVANASLLDEATAAAEAMAMCFAVAGAGGGGHEGPAGPFFVAGDCHPQTIAVVRTRAEAMGVEIVVGSPKSVDVDSRNWCGLLLQVPATDGRIECYQELTARAHKRGAMVVVATDLLALTLIKPPGEWGGGTGAGGGGGADIAVGSAQRFGVPMGYGGPHAAFLATKNEFVRRMPGRLVGVSRDSRGQPAFRLAIQTREQHIKRERATSNICTAQALLAIIASMYAVYHGPDGLRAIANRIVSATRAVRVGLLRLGHTIGDDLVFDTLRVKIVGKLSAADVLAAARARRLNFRDFGDGSLGISLDETVSEQDIRGILASFGGTGREDITAILRSGSPQIPPVFARSSPFLTNPVFNSHHSETDLLRYIFKLQSRDLSLAHSMIPLGSCTMKLNATSEMLPVTWPEFARIHPFAPADQTRGYARIIADLEKSLAEITGLAAVSLQPNAGSQGEFAGLLAIRAYHAANGDPNRKVCLIPDSAHGTNPASATIAGLRVVPVRCDERGNVDLDDLRAQAGAHRDDLAALMITYPSTHGVFEEGIREICKIVHDHGGQVYMDGANMNAQVGLCRPGDIGADVCHLNLHKTFCIPHGGGGPGMGPIAVAKHLAPFLPSDPLSLSASSRIGGGSASSPGRGSVGPVSAAPFGSALILTISWVYIALMGADGLRRATEVAILNANYMARRLQESYPVLFAGSHGRVAHEFIIDARPFEATTGIKVEDIAKRLMDFGFHAPTMSFPVPGTLMIEPTESESKAELDRFCDALIAIREEIRAIEQGESDRADNPLKNAPHTAFDIADDAWSHPYGRTQAVFPAAWVREHKFWPAVNRIDNPYGDRNLVCTCPPMSEIS